MAGTDGGERKIKVVDRRWFDESGELRRELPKEPRETADAGTGGGAAAESGTPAPGQEAGRRAQSARGGGGVSWPSAVTFLQLVDFLAQQASLLLTGTQELPANPQQARIFIDFLGLLEERTRGNLTPEEARVLADVLFQLRAAYIQSTGG